jgi:hypothetical protein
VTNISNNLLEGVIKLGLVILFAAIVFQFIGVELSTVADRVAESLQKATY